MHLGTVVLLLVAAFALNLPLGAWRRSQRKFSPAWFLGIHASIPLLFLARVELDVSRWVIPLEVALVLAGQVTGARLGAWTTEGRQKPAPGWIRDAGLHAAPALPALAARAAVDTSAHGPGERDDRDARRDGNEHG